MAAFTQAFGSSTLDASALVIPRVGFLPPTDPRVRSTVEQIRRHLTRDGLVYRYRTSDGLAGGEGTFTLCTFWLVEALALGGRLDEARELFERTVGYANDLGLLAEEINPDTLGAAREFSAGIQSHGADRCGRQPGQGGPSRPRAPGRERVGTLQPRGERRG